MRRLPLLLLALACLTAAPDARSAPRELWPGVTYERGAQFTAAGPAAIHILRGPRPGGLTTLAPVLSNDTILRRETLTSMQHRLAPVAASAGVNGDLFSFATGRPSGIVLRDGELQSPPSSGRSSAGIRVDGTLDVRRVRLFGTWSANGVKHTLATLNAVPPANGSALFTPAYGAETPVVPGSASAVLFPFPYPAPGLELAAPVADQSGPGRLSIPLGGAVLVARGSAADMLRAEAPPGSTVRVRLQLRPGWDGVVQAIGGGPQIVRNGVPIFQANEQFASSHLLPRAPRSAVGQLRDGRLLLVAVDGRQPGYSTGMTNFELAQTLARLGAVTGMALDGGGSTAMAFDGSLLSRPSGGGERAISTALMFLYTGAFVPAPPAVVSPNGDGVDDDPGLEYRLVGRSRVTARLLAPGGSVAWESSAERAAGTYRVDLPGGAREGGWRLVVSSVDELGRESEMSRSFTVNNTLGFLRLSPPRLLRVPPGGARLLVTFELESAARVRATVEDATGRTIRRLALRTLAPGEPTLTWDGLDAKGKRPPNGVILVRVRAQNALGAVELSRQVRLRRVAAAPGTGSSIP